jgi:acyl-CoA thioesterase-1
LFPFAVHNELQLMPDHSPQYPWVRFPFRVTGRLSTRAAIAMVVLTSVIAGSGCGPGGDASVTRDKEPVTAVRQSANGVESHADGAATERSDNSAAVTLLFFGDSITAGYGLARQEEAYPYVFERIAADNGIAAAVTSAGNSGETTAGGVRRIDWVLKSDYDIVVIELGGNDGLRGVPVETVSANLQTIVDKVRTLSPGSRIVIAGMRLPPSLGSGYVSSFESVFADVAAKNDVELIPFILDGVAGDPSLNQMDGIHPTADGHAVIAEKVFRQLEPLLLQEAPATN